MLLLSMEFRHFKILAMINEMPLIVSKNFGRGKMICLSFHPSEKRDQEGVFTSLLKHMLGWLNGEARDHLDFSG